MDRLIDELSNKVYEQLARHSLSRTLQIFNLELAEVSCQHSLTTTGKLESNSMLARKGRSRKYCGRDCYEHRLLGLGSCLDHAALAHRLSFVPTHAVFVSSFLDLLS
jgi:hypothetical protein